MEHKLTPYHPVDQVAQGTALILAPHPDDEVFGCGGTIMRHVMQGDPVKVIIVTDGSHGVKGADKAAYVLQRQDESRAAAAVMGCPIPDFWGLPDRGIEYGEKWVIQVIDAISRHRAEVVYAPSIFEMHPDHRALAMIAIEAVRRIGDPVQLAMYEIGVPLRPNRLLDITYLRNRKREAMACFSSQLQRQNYIDHIEALNRFRTYTLPAGVQAAEAYYLVSASELAHDPLGVYASEARRCWQLDIPFDMPAQPLVSVIVRSTDQPSLDDVLACLALQTYPRLEVIIVDTIGDHHRSVSPWCGRFPLRLVATGHQLTRSQAANLGIEAAHGHYLAFLDENHLIDASHLVSLVGLLETNSDVAVAHADVDTIRLVNGGIESVAINQPYYPFRLIYQNYLPTHSVVFKRALIEKGCRFDESLDVAEDWDFWMQIALHTEFICSGKTTSSCQGMDDSVMAGWHPASSIQTIPRTKFYAKWLRHWKPEQIEQIFREQRQQHHALLIQMQLIEQELNNCQTSLESVEKQNALLQLELIKQREKLQAFKNHIYQSTSWRLTTPIRWLKRNIFFYKRNG